MTKYSTPSIEVISFNSSDAPRIGMQWWVLALDNTSYFALPGFTPTNLSGPQNTPANIPEINCAAVSVYYCLQENIEGARDIFGQGIGHFNVISDDGVQSC